MVKKLRELLKLTKMARKESVSMQRKLALYWFSMAATVFGALMLIFSLTGVFSNTDRELRLSLNIQLQNTATDISNQIERLSGQGIFLSEQASRELMEVLPAYGSRISSLNDRPEALLELQRSLYPALNTTLHTSDCSGAFIVLNATTNTLAGTAEHSRSGVYLRYTSLTPKKSSNQQVIYFRGISDIAREEDLELHNRWNLEFDISRIPGYDEMMQTPVRRLADAYAWTGRLHLPDTWEDVILLCVPVLDGNGDVAGLCGMELSSLYFGFCYAAVESQFGPIVSVLAPLENGQLLLDQGMTGRTEGTYLDVSNVLSVQEGQYYNTYSEGTNQYIGLHKTILFASGDGREWAAAILLPKESYASYASGKQVIWIACSLAFLLTMLVSAATLSRSFARPIAQSLAAIQSNVAIDANPSGISEIDALIAFIKSREQSQAIAAGSLPPDIAELFDAFAARMALLTETEHEIFKLYVDGHEIGEIPELAFISINTVRKHNRNIYEKLCVTSRDELMLYIELFRRCNRLDELL